MRSIFTTILPSITMLSLSFRDRISMGVGRFDGGSSDGLVEVVRAARRQGDGPGDVQAQGGGGVWREVGDKLPHEVEGALKEAVVLLGALPDALEEGVVFLDQGG